MKKTLSKISSILCALFSCCIVSCDNGGNIPPKTYTYYGVVQTLEGFDGLYMQVPDFGVCQLPTYEDGKVPNLAIKEGDLLEIKFSSQIQVTKSYPAIISTPARSSSVCKNDIDFEVTSEYYLLTIDYTQEMKNELLSFDKHIGDDVYFWRYKGVPTKNGGVLSVQDYATATIEMITGNRLTLSLSLEQDMQEFLKYYASDDLELKAKKMDGDEEGFCNFFDVQDALELTDVEKVEIITMAGSISPEHREPTEYITSENLEDCTLIYNWLKSITRLTTNEITQADTFVEGGSCKILTVSTKRGDFRIYETAGSFLNIWDRYLAMVGIKMPEIVGDSVSYKFDYSTEEKVGFYKWNQFAREYDFKISELSFKKTKRDYTLPRIGYFLKTDVGIIELYSEKIFYHEGTSCYYEVVGEENFSIIFDTQLPPTDKELENYERIIEIYTEKYCKDLICQNVVLEYYGEYESGAIVALVYCSGRGYATYEWTETVAGYDFKYGDANSIKVFYNGDCYSLLQAYSNGYLTQEDIATISIKRTIFEYFSLIR